MVYYHPDVPLRFSGALSGFERDGAYISGRIEELMDWGNINNLKNIPKAMFIISSLPLNKFNYENEIIQTC